MRQAIENAVDPSRKPMGKPWCWGSIIGCSIWLPICNHGVFCPIVGALKESTRPSWSLPTGPRSWLDSASVCWRNAWPMTCTTCSIDTIWKQGCNCWTGMLPVQNSMVFFVLPFSSSNLQRTRFGLQLQPSCTMVPPSTTRILFLSAAPMPINGKLPEWNTTLKSKGLCTPLWLFAHA